MRSNEDQLELFADLIEPAAEIIGDKAVAKILQTGGKPAKAVKIAIKNHKQAVIELLARLDGVDPENYVVPGPIGLTMKLINLFNQPDIKDLFTVQEQSEIAADSGPAMETTGDGVN